MRGSEGGREGMREGGRDGGRHGRTDGRTDGETDGWTDEGNSIDSIFEVPAEVIQFTRKQKEDGGATEPSLDRALVSLVHTFFSNI